MDAGRALESVGATLVCRAGLRDARSGCAPFVVTMELPDRGDRHDVGGPGSMTGRGIGVSLPNAKLAILHSEGAGSLNRLSEFDDLRGPLGRAALINAAC
jgi:hypothetical protein